MRSRQVEGHGMSEQGKDNDKEKVHVRATNSPKKRENFIKAGNFFELFTNRSIERLFLMEQEL